MQELTREDLDRALAHFGQDMREGFHGVHSRLDKLNDRTRKVEEGTATLRARTTSVEKEVFRDRREGVQQAAPAESLISGRDTRVLLVALLIMATLFKGVEWGFEKIAMIAAGAGS